MFPDALRPGKFVLAQARNYAPEQVARIAEYGRRVRQGAERDLPVRHYLVPYQSYGGTNRKDTSPRGRGNRRLSCGLYWRVAFGPLPHAPARLSHPGRKLWNAYYCAPVLTTRMARHHETSRC